MFHFTLLLKRQMYEDSEETSQHSDEGRRKLPAGVKSADCEHRATMTEWLDCSPLTYANRVQSPAGSLRIFASGYRAGRYHWSAGFLGDLPFPPPLHSGAAPYSPHFTLIGSQYLDHTSTSTLFPALLHTPLAPPSSALKTSMLRATNALNLNHADGADLRGAVSCVLAQYGGSVLESRVRRGCIFVYVRLFSPAWGTRLTRAVKPQKNWPSSAAHWQRGPGVDSRPRCLAVESPLLIEPRRWLLSLVVHLLTRAMDGEIRIRMLRWFRPASFDDRGHCRWSKLLREEETGKESDMACINHRLKMSRRRLSVESEGDERHAKLHLDGFISAWIFRQTDSRTKFFQVLYNSWWRNCPKYHTAGRGAPLVLR
ncbi:hypothetical protein PR048_024826 [Dryococelus australis]|uniref:Uncharacterized protein n=1 Tax=Dryococelus australis TaxID=614101 RepID=A0ABQ9GPP0_9NEOP|nr:hypothetical protein PR048_024826 [Dryococelus australis]